MTSPDSERPPLRVLRPIKLVLERDSDGNRYFQAADPYGNLTGITKETLFARGGRVIVTRTAEKRPVFKILKGGR